MLNDLSRRSALKATGLIAGASILPALPALAAPDTVAVAMDAIKKLTGGKEPVKGKIKLNLPQIAENGNTVPLGVSVDSPMTADSHVQEVTIFVTKNPLPIAISFLFTPESGKAEASTHIRLAETQDVIAVAKMSDGTFCIDTKNCKVTIGGCGG